MGKASRRKKTLIDGARTGEDNSAYPTRPEPDEIAERSAKRTRLHLLLIILLVSFAVYFNALFNGFVHDDRSQVVINPWIKNIRHVPEIFSKNVWFFLGFDALSNYYRPMMHMIYMIDFHVFGLKSWGFHLTNLLFHTGTSILVFILTSRLLSEPVNSSRSPSARYSDPTPTSTLSSKFLYPPFIAALLFATHPIHTEAVTWIAGLPDLSFTFFYLLSFYLYVMSGKDGLPAKRFYWSSLLSFALSALCKEPALTLPLILIAYDCTFKGKRNFSAYARVYIPFLFVIGIYMILRFHALEGFAPGKRHTDLSTYQYFINIFPLFTQYIEKLLLPVDLNAFYTLHPLSSILEPKGILSLASVAAFIAVTIISFKKNAGVFLGLLLIAIPLIPALYIPALGENTFAERYLYLPSVGFVMLSALLVAKAKAHYPGLSSVMTLVCVVIIGAYSVGTVIRNAVWKDNYTYWTDTARKSPDSVIPLINLGYAYIDRGLTEKAIEQFRTALNLSPDNSLAFKGLASAYEKKGLIDEAVKQYRIASAIEPNNGQIHYDLATLYLKSGLPDKAIEEFQIVSQSNPNLDAIHNNLGLAYDKKGLIDKAIEEYQIALRLNPDDDSTNNNLGMAYGKKGFIDEAIKHLQLALRLNPENTDAHINLGTAFAIKGLIDDAIRQYQIALKLDPQSVKARNNLESLYNKKGTRSGQ